MGTFKRTKCLIKGMCCARCVSVLKDELAQLAPRVLSVRIGEVGLKYDEEKAGPAGVQAAIEDSGYRARGPKGKKRFSQAQLRQEVAK